MGKVRRGKRKKKQKKQPDVAEKVVEEVEEINTVDKKAEAIHYLKTWKKDRDNWSFKKVRQTWLLKKTYDLEMISDKYFRYLLKYLKGLKGTAKETTIKDAEIMRDKTMDADDEESNKKHDRAVEVLKLLA